MKMITTSINRLNRHAALLAAGLLTVAMPAYAELPFPTATAERRDAPLERLLDGTVEAVNQATMSAQTAGRIAEVFYDVDDFVEPGQPVVRFSDVEQQAALRQANAALSEANALSSEASDHFERVAGLFASGSRIQTR